MIFDVSHCLKPFLSQVFVKLISIRRKWVGGWEIFKIYQNTEQYVTISRLKKHFKHCRSNDGVHDCCASILSRQNNVSGWSFVLNTLLLTCFVC